MAARVAAVGFVAVLASCTLDEVDLVGKRCPCAVGWVCDAVTNRCVEELVGIDGGRDATVARDAGLDARTLDATAPIDAPPGVDAPGGLDAPPGVDAGPDAGPDPTACDDTLGGALFCDGFEADDDLAAWAMTTGSGASVSRTTDVVFRGTGALLAETTASTGYMQLKHYLSPVTSGDLWMRAYLLIPEDATVTAFDTFFLRSVMDPGYHGAVMTLRSPLRPTVWVSEIASAYAAPDALVRDRWTCFEMHIAVGNPGSITLYVDGAAAATATDIDASPPGGYSIFSLGITWSSSMQIPTRIYYDEAAVGLSRLPCD